MSGQSEPQPTSGVVTRGSSAGTLPLRGTTSTSQAKGGPHASDMTFTEQAMDRNSNALCLAAPLGGGNSRWHLLAREHRTTTHTELKAEAATRTRRRARAQALLVGLVAIVIAEFAWCACAQPAKPPIQPTPFAYVFDLG